MKALKNTEPAPSSAYEVEQTLRVFADLTSEGLSTLLGALVAETEEALQSPNITEKNQALKLSLRALDQALFISRNLRYFSKKSPISNKALDVSEQVLHTLDHLEKDLKDHHIELGAFVESGIYSRLDAGALEHILSNLLLNAMSTMPTGGKLTVALGKNSTQLEFCVSDTGNGLTKDQLDHLFEPYYAIHHHSFHLKDRGLGLLVAKALIESQGGELIVRSSVGKGTNFIFTLPYDPKVEKPEPYLQKRRFQRVQLTIPVQVTFPHEEPMLTRITTLSTGGCFLELPSEHPAPTKNTLLTLTLLSLGDCPLLIENARVANTASTGSGTGMGIEFPKLEKRTNRILTAIIKGHR